LALIIQEIQAVGTRGLRQLALIIREIQAVGTNNSGDSGCWHHQRIRPIGTEDSEDLGY